MLNFLCEYLLYGQLNLICSKHCRTTKKSHNNLSESSSCIKSHSNQTMLHWHQWKPPFWLTLNHSSLQFFWTEFKFFLKDSCLFREFIISDSSSPGENYNSEEKKRGSWGQNYGYPPMVKSSYKNLVYVWFLLEEY